MANKDKNKKIKSVILVILKLNELMGFVLGNSEDNGILLLSHSLEMIFISAAAEHIEGKFWWSYIKTSSLIKDTGPMLNVKLEL